MMEFVDAADNDSGADSGTSTTTDPVAEERDLLDDLVQVWGNSVGLDPDSAAAIILTVAGGIAGNSVRINAPMVGELGPDLQIAVVRDMAPALCRGLQRLLAHFEGSIMRKLRDYEHLSTQRAQRQELSALESRLNLLLVRSSELEKVTSDENAMVNLALKCQEAQVLAEYEDVKKQVASVAAQIRALRFRMRPMVMVSRLGVAEIENIAPHAYDSAVMEVVSTPGHFHRLPLLKERNLERIAAFRRNSGCSSRLEFHEGEYRPRSAVTSVILAGGDELVEAGRDRMLQSTGIMDDLLVCRPVFHEFNPTPLPDPGERWAEVVDRLFSNRLDRAYQLFVFDDEARMEFLARRQEMLGQGRSYEEKVSLIWRESGPALLAKLALCVRLLRQEEGSKVDVRDVRAAARVAMRLLAMTTAHWKKVLGNIRKQGMRARRKMMVKQLTEDPVAKMVAKLQRISPCTKRTLFRTYSKQNYAVLQPILDRAVGLGLVQRDGEELRMAGTVGKEDEVRCV